MNNINFVSLIITEGYELISDNINLYDDESK